ncbi:hypothetical protein [Actinokineospora sp. UTMC 2448]|uniref:hypothetical protein n=1 Tax=Actinokineospora sp. UTMC 2448 TaxID=2268449 RepID=UPI002164BA39|nr:hypothetical protein [Actinokineospora sp. UTMC 2448]UVS78008.1 hypothetical protein Actkin_01732 [Actinokineospora sp. UTMC 2448]
MTPDPRADLARRQADLLRAVLADGPPPPGFDERMLAIEATALLAKRRRVNAIVDPDTAAELGDRYRELFDTWAKAHPRPAGTRARADAAAFREWALPAKRRRWWQRR